MVADIRKESFGDEWEQAKDVSDITIADYLLELIYNPTEAGCRYYWFKTIAAKWVLDKLGDKK